ncbi:MAG: DUF1513 domain-containing protein [Pseudomonadota bacterium]
MTTRRAFVAGALAAGFAPTPTWAEAGSPRYLSAARKADGRFALFGLSATAEVLFEIGLPARGHAAAAHPHRPEAVAFARRPGTYALVIDCVTGRSKAGLAAPEGRHFYGHGAFSSDGALLFTTENDYEGGTGRVGVWNAKGGYVRIGEFTSGGIGPHDIKLMPDGQTLVVANGGIDTHPDTGRAKLNIPTMRPNLSFIHLNGRIEESVELDDALRLNSIRHLAVGSDGTVAFAMQWQGDVSDAVPLLGLRHADGAITLVDTERETGSDLQGYVGSVAIDRLGQLVAITSPRGGVFQVIDAKSAQVVVNAPIPDACGVAMAEEGFVVTSGDGLISIGLGAEGDASAMTQHHWDNHLIPVGDLNS